MKKLEHINIFTLNYWQINTDVDFFNRLTTINWQVILQRVKHSPESQKFSSKQFSSKFYITAIAKYGLFLSLIQKYPYIKMVPNQEIDMVLHAHITDISQFRLDCHNLFSTYLNHKVEVGKGGKAERYQWLENFSHTRKIFEQHFGIGAMGSYIPACCEILLEFA